MSRGKLSKPGEPASFPLASATKESAGCGRAGSVEPHITLPLPVIFLCLSSALTWSALPVRQDVCVPRHLQQPLLPFLHPDLVSLPPVSKCKPGTQLSPRVSPLPLWWAALPTLLDPSLLLVGLAWEHPLAFCIPIEHLYLVPVSQSSALREALDIPSAPAHFLNSGFSFSHSCNGFSSDATESHPSPFLCPLHSLCRTSPFLS